MNSFIPVDIVATPTHFNTSDLMKIQDDILSLKLEVTEACINLNDIRRELENLLSSVVMTLATQALSSISLQTKDTPMDKQIRKIEKGVKKSEKELKGLEKADKKRDKVCDYGEKMMEKKKAK